MRRVNWGKVIGYGLLVAMVSPFVILFALYLLIPILVVFGGAAALEP